MRNIVCAEIAFNKGLDFYIENSSVAQDFSSASNALSSSPIKSIKISAATIGPTWSRGEMREYLSFASLEFNITGQACELSCFRDILAHKILSFKDAKLA